VFVDIEEDTFNLDPRLVGDAITERTKAIMPVQLFGQACDMGAILDAAGDIPVVEDAAQALSAAYEGRKVGSIGALGCFSFFPSKNLGGFGDGGMITTNDDELAARLRSLRVHGAEDKYFHRVIGFNSRLDALQATVLRVKLPHLDSWSDARAANAARYNELLAGAAVVTPVARRYARHVYNQYTLRTQDRDGLMARLKEREIGCAIYYPLPLHLQECFADLGGKEGDLPVSEKASREVLSIPVYPELTEEMLAYVADTIREFVG
jgi:dTDP-4-amino-4,6-dideoxygalactose transaminase